MTDTALHDAVKIGIVSISDRASTGVYEDKGLPALQEWLGRALLNPITFEPRLIPDEQARISQTLIELVDAGCALVLTTGGTGPALRDVTPEATLAVADKEMPGFGEQMRQISLRFVPTAILSRQVAVIRGRSLIINLPGQPKSIAETLEGLKDAQGQSVVSGIFAAVPYCIDLIGGPYLETRESVIAAFRPKSFAAESAGGAAPEVVAAPVPELGATGTAQVTAVHVEETSGPKLDEAAIVVSGGRGLGEAPKYEMIETLAKLLKGAPGASRAIVDAGWVPYSYQVGQTGKVVKPTVYIAAGISGATQHMVGMKGSKNIIAINKDKEAPIFGIADLGIVGDVNKVLPKLIEALQARG